MDLQKMIRNDKTRLNEDFEHLLSELELSTYTVRKLIQGKKEKRQNAKSLNFIPSFIKLILFKLISFTN